MARAPNSQLRYSVWPEKDRRCWSDAFRAGLDPFDDFGPGAHLAGPTQKALQASYGRFLGYLSSNCPGMLCRPPEERVDRETVAKYVAFRLKTCSESGIAVDLHHLRLALRCICPAIDWSWLQTITKRIAAKGGAKRKKPPVVTSEKLYALGIEIMDHAAARAEAAGTVSKPDAMRYRDGLLIALLALLTLRRRTVTALRIGRQLFKSGDVWELDLPAEDLKAAHPLDYPVSPEVSLRIDTYVSRFRPHIPRASEHDGVWASNKGRPMDDGTIYDMVRRRTLAKFGVPISLHDFRHGAGTFWSIHDPVNVRGVKDLLGHSSFETTGHYITAQSRLAGHALQRAINRARKRPLS
jgi:integrase